MLVDIQVLLENDNADIAGNQPVDKRYNLSGTAGNRKR
jgi:hypothetical protein